MERLFIIYNLIIFYGVDKHTMFATATYFTNGDLVVILQGMINYNCIKLTSNVIDTGLKVNVSNVERWLLI